MNKTIKNLHVLVVDDEPLIHDMMRAILESRKYKVSVANNGLEALHAMAKQEFDVVFMDCMMPVMDGFEVARTIRDSDSSKDTYVLMITGSRRKRDMMQVLVCGADDYLIKPFDTMDLRIHLRSAMRILHLLEELDELELSVQENQHQH